MHIELDPEDIKAIADEVISSIKPLIASIREPQDELLTITEVAALLKLSKDQIYQWVNRSQHGLGDFPFYKAGKLLRFSRNAVMKWLESR